MANRGNKTKYTCLSSPDRSAWINVDGEMTQVYDIQEEGNKISGIIESIEGASFTVDVLDNTLNPKVDFCVHLELDGVKASGINYRKERSFFKRPIGDKKRRTTFTGHEIANDQELPFYFTEPRISNDDASSNIDSNEEIGTIRIKIWRGKVTDANESSSQAEFNEPKKQVVVSSSKKKNISHQIGFRAPIGSKDTGRSIFNYADRKSKPLTIFEFTYMSRDRLVKEALISESRSSKSNAKKRTSITKEESPLLDLEHSSELPEVKEENAEENDKKRRKLDDASEAEVERTPDDISLNHMVLEDETAMEGSADNTGDWASFLNQFA